MRFDPPQRRAGVFRRRFLFAALYFSEGAPIGYIWWALPTKLRAHGVSHEQISTLTAVLVLPWVFKFIWAPLIDAFPIPRVGMRGWIVVTQTCMGLALIPFFFMGIESHLTAAAVLLFVHAFFAATQDAAIDAYSIAHVPIHERGSINAWMQVGMLGGRSLFGGAVLYLEQWTGTAATLPALLVCIWSTMILVIIIRPDGANEGGAPVRPRNRGEFGAALRQSLRSPTTWMALAFAAVGGAAYEGVGVMVGPMLIDAGVSQATSGLFRAVPVVLALAAGSLIGGKISDRIDRRPSVIFFTLTVAVSAVMIAGVHAASLSAAWLMATTTLLYMAIGAFTASTYAMFMDLTDPRLGATQFSALMGATNLCESWSALAIGRLVALWGYAAAIFFLAIPTAASTALVRWMTPRSFDSKGR